MPIQNSAGAPNEPTCSLMGGLPAVLGVKSIFGRQNVGPAVLVSERLPSSVALRAAISGERKPEQP